MNFNTILKSQNDDRLSNNSSTLLLKDDFDHCGGITEPSVNTPIMLNADRKSSSGPGPSSSHNRSSSNQAQANISKVQNIPNIMSFGNMMSNQNYI